MEQRLAVGPVHPFALIGRSPELGVVERFLSSAVGEGVLVWCGEPGIGKSVLWEAGIQLARSQGFVTLCARASESEARLSFAGVSDLLEGVDSEVMEELPAPQRHALEVAVGRVEPSDRPPEPLTVAAGLLGVLRVVAGRERLLVAVDDLARLDGASAAALVFAARRLVGHKVRFLVSRRRDQSSDLERVLERAGVVVRELGPLSLGAISRLLADRLGQSLPRRALRAVYENSGGNPLFALELGRAMLERGLPQIGAELPMPERLEDLFGARVVALAPGVRQALLAVALSGELTVEELAVVVDQLAIEDARRSGVLVVDGSRTRAAHPLLAHAALARSSALERRDLHVALAGAVADEVLRARHLALAASAADRELAAELSRAAAAAAARGAAQDAADLAGHALRLTPAGESGYEKRLLALARFLIGAGEHARASELVAERLDALPAGRARAAAHLVLAEGAELSVEDEHLEQALAQSAGDPGLRAETLAVRALVLVINRVRRIVDGEELARKALVAARSAAPDAERRALVALSWARIMRGLAIDDLLERSADMPMTSSLHDASLERPAGVRLVFRGELGRARDLFRRLLASAEERGEAHSGMVLTVQLCEIELRAGDTFAVARGLEEWDQWTILDREASAVRARVEAVLAALRGNSGRATALATEVLEPGKSKALEWDRLEALRASGLAAVLDRDRERAISHLEAVWRHTVREGVEDPGAFPVAGDLVEALAEAGRLERAGEVTGWLGALAAAQRHPWGLATLKRSEAVVRLAKGYDDDAAEDLAGAAAGYHSLGLAFDSARALLVLGRLQRRAKKRAAARQSLQQAQAAFDRLGCPGWAEAASAELARVSGRRAAPAGGLTPSELRVAELVASGLSNKEVAAQLYLSVYTVEAHLSNAYAKLGIRSRTQLAGRLGAST